MSLRCSDVRALRGFVFGFVPFLFASGAWAQRELPHDLAARLQAIVAERKVPGLVAVVLHGERVVAAGAAGVRKAGAPELLTRPWARGERAGDIGRVLSSQGDNGFWHCEAWLAPEIDFAVLVACNQGGAAGDKPAALASRDALEALVRAFAPRSVQGTP